MLSIARSYRTDRNVDLVHEKVISEGGEALVEGLAQSDMTTTRAEVKLLVNKPDKAPVMATKRFLVDGLKCPILQFVGKLKVVLSTDEDKRVFTHGGEFGRQYLDILLSQTDRGYLKGLKRYRDTLRQRDQILKQDRGRRSKLDELEHWNGLLANESSNVMAKRMLAVRELNRISETSELGKSLGLALDIRYTPGVASRFSARFPANKYKSAVKFAVASELRKKSTSNSTKVGAHRDELTFNVKEGQPVGLMSVLLKVYAAQYILANTDYKPVALFGNSLDGLGQGHRKLLLEEISQCCEQVLVSTSDEKWVGEAMQPTAEVKVAS